MMNEVSMSPTKKQKRQRRKFTPEFKAEAVRIVRTSGKSVHAVARELDLTETCLRSWVQQAEVDANPDPRGALTTDERAELVRLRRELRTVEQERDFLKKTAAYFAKSQS
jgi:transposase